MFPLQTPQLGSFVELHGALFSNDRMRDGVVRCPARCDEHRDRCRQSRKRGSNHQQRIPAWLRFRRASSILQPTSWLTAMYPVWTRFERPPLLTRITNIATFKLCEVG